MWSLSRWCFLQSLKLYNSKSPWKWMVGKLYPFPLGQTAYFQWLLLLVSVMIEMFFLHLPRKVPKCWSIDPIHGVFRILFASLTAGPCKISHPNRKVIFQSSLLFRGKLLNFGGFGYVFISLESSAQASLQSYRGGGTILPGFLTGRGNFQVTFITWKRSPRWEWKKHIIL